MVRLELEKIASRETHKTELNRSFIQLKQNDRIIKLQIINRSATKEGREEFEQTFFALRDLMLSKGYKIKKETRQ